MTNREMIQKLEKVLRKEIVRITDLSNKIEDENKIEFTKGMVAGIRHALLKLPICFDDNDNIT
jgi:hypothetical protein